MCLKLDTDFFFLLFFSFFFFTLVSTVICSKCFSAGQIINNQTVVFMSIESQRYRDGQCIDFNLRMKLRMKPQCLIYERILMTDLNSSNISKDKPWVLN